MEENSRIKGTFADRPPKDFIFPAEVPDGGLLAGGGDSGRGSLGFEGERGGKSRGVQGALTRGEIVAGDEAEEGARRRRRRLGLLRRGRPEGARNERERGLA